MIILRKALLIIFIFCFYYTFGNNNYPGLPDDNFNPSKYIPLNISYYGNFLTHPGIKLSTDWNLYMYQKSKPRRHKTITNRSLLYVSPGIIYYNHKASHKGLTVYADLSWRRYMNSLFYTETSISAGYLRRFNAGETWELQDDGTVKNIGTTSRGYFTPSISFAFGKQFNAQNPYPFALFVRLNTNMISSFNLKYVIDISGELGLRFYLGGGVREGKVKTRIKGD